MSPVLFPRQANDIAFQWHGGQETALYSFASTGGVVHNEKHRAALMAEIRNCFDFGMPDERAELVALIDYIENRMEIEARGRTPDLSTKRLFIDLCGGYSSKDDPWGTAMNARFTVAETLYWGYELTVSDFTPGVGVRDHGPDTDDYVYQGIVEMQPTKADLVRLDKFLERLTGRLDRAGRSY